MLGIWFGSSRSVAPTSMMAVGSDHALEEVLIALPVAPHFIRIRLDFG